ncbi:MAG: hypothetical protein IT279_14900, partial [Ignavibacteriaceae bacterium]|nr:hypothetical protein [Ignavibacteriaceae bacterium]
MLRCSCKIIANILTFVVVIAFLSLMFIPLRDVVAEKGEHGVENVNKLKYADP